MVGPFFLLVLVRTASQVFKRGTRVAKWLAKVMDKIGSSYGFESGQKLGGMNFYAGKSVEATEA